MALPLRTKMLYGLSCSANNLHIHFDTFLLTYYLTDVLGVSGAFIAGMYLITRLFDAFSDPVEGFLIDRTRTRWGRFRPYLLLVPIPFALIRIFLYATPALDGPARNAYVVILYILAGSAASFLLIALNALLASMTKETEERNSLSGWYTSLGLVTTLVLSTASKPLIDLFPSEQAGFLGVVTLFTTLATLIYFIVFLSVREQAGYQATGYSLKQVFPMVRKNKPLLVLCLANVFTMAIKVILPAAAIYFFKYCVEREDLYPLFMLTFMGFVVLSSALTPCLATRLGKTRLYRGSSLLTMAGALLLFLTPAENVPLVFVFSSLIGLGSGPPFVLLYSMGADTVEFGEYTNGSRAEGLTMATIGLTNKLSGAVAGGMAAFILQVSGYIPNVSQTPLALFGIKSQVTLIPFLFALIALWVIRAYPLDKKEYLFVLSELKRNQQAVHG